MKLVGARAQGFVAALACCAGAIAAEHPVLLETFTRPVVLGMYLSFGRSLQQGSITLMQYQCLKATPASALYPAVEEILAGALSEPELDEAEQFFASETGVRYARRGLLLLYRAAGEPVPGPVPEFSQEENLAIATFAKSGAGGKIIRDAVLEGPEVQVKLGRAIRAATEHCREK